MPKIIDYEKRKHTIIEQAMKVFIEKGYHDTNFLDIAERCNLGRTTLYQYFENKDEVYDEVIRHISAIIENECRIIMKSPDLTFIEKIKQIVYRLSVDYKNQKNAMLMFVEALLLNKRKKTNSTNRVNERVVGLREIFKELLHEGMKAKEIKKVNKESMAFTLYALVESLVLQSSYDGGIVSQQCLKNINLFIDGLKI